MAKLKVRYQAMLDNDVYRLLTEVNDKARHKSLSETINAIIRKYFKIVEENTKQTGQAKDIQKPKRVKAINSLEQKYGPIKRYE